MKKLAMLVIVAAASCATGATAASLWGPKGQFRTALGGRLEYDPSLACYKPMRPYTKDKWAMDQYLQSGKIYINCLKDATMFDMEYAAEVINEGNQKATDNFLLEVRRGY